MNIFVKYICIHIEYLWKSPQAIGNQSCLWGEWGKLGTRVSWDSFTLCLFEYCTMCFHYLVFKKVASIRMWKIPLVDTNPEVGTLRSLVPLKQAISQSLWQDPKCSLQALDWHSGWGREGDGVGEEGPDFFLKHLKKTRKKVPSCFEVGNLDTESTGRDFPGGAVVKNLPANAGNTFTSPGPGRSHMLRSN